MPEDPSGQIERVTLYVCGGCGRISRWDATARCECGTPHGSDNPLEYIPESTHYSELERLAGVVDEAVELLRQAPDDELVNEVFGRLDDLATALRDSVPISLTRGESDG